MDPSRWLQSPQTLEFYYFGCRTCEVISFTSSSDLIYYNHLSYKKKRWYAQRGALDFRFPGNSEK